MFKNMLNRRLVLISGVLVIITVIGLFVYTQKIKKQKISSEGAAIDENIIPEWATYRHPSLGYTIEYPKNILPFIGFGDGPTFTFFYKNTREGNPHFLVSVFSSQGMSVPESNKTFKTKTLKKIVVSGVDAYIITDSEYPNTTNLQLSTGGVLYSIGFGGLPMAIIDHIVNSFHINFVPASMKLR